MGKQALVIRKAAGSNITPELAAKAEKRQSAWTKEAEKKTADNKEKYAELQRSAYKRAVQYEQEYVNAENSLKNRREQAYLSGNFFVEPQPKLAFAIRIRGLKDVLPKAKKALRLMRLNQINTGVFIRLNKSSLQLLKIVEPYVAWGYVNRQMATKLLYARGYGKIGNCRSRLNSNQDIASSLGAATKVECMEDLVHEIVTVGSNFKRVNNFLWPFKLHAPRGGYKSIKKHYIIGGSFGNREEQINTLINRMI